MPTLIGLRRKEIGFLILRRDIQFNLFFPTNGFYGDERPKWSSSCPHPIIVRKKNNTRKRKEEKVEEEENMRKINYFSTKIKIFYNF